MITSNRPYIHFVTETLSRLPPCGASSRTVVIQHYLLRFFVAICHKDPAEIILQKIIVICVKSHISFSYKTRKSLFQFEGSRLQNWSAEKSLSQANVDNNVVSNLTYLQYRLFAGKSQMKNKNY